MFARIAVVMPDGSMSSFDLTDGALEALLEEVRLGELITSELCTPAEALAVLLDGIAAGDR